MRHKVSLIMLLGASASTLTVAEVPFNGKSGEALLQGVAVASRPAAAVDKSKLDFTMRDEFTGTDVAVCAGKLPDGYSWNCLVPSEWWDNSKNTYGAMVSGDIYNLLPLTDETARNRRELVPGDVSTPVFSNQWWKAGQGFIYGVETDLYSPPEALRGELARAFFYMSAVYHVALWTPRGFMMMTAKSYPGLTDYALTLLLDWHRTYPPSDRERVKNERGETLQGNRNPFVDYPELAEYIWGTHKDDSFIVEGEPQPLRSTYSLSTDRIDLYSPEIPSDAEWMIDGLPTASTSVSATDLGKGEHRISYMSWSTGEKGMVLIKILDR